MEDKKIESIIGFEVLLSIIVIAFTMLIHKDTRVRWGGALLNKMMPIERDMDIKQAEITK